LKGEALVPTLWITCYGRGYESVVRQTTEWMNEWLWIMWLTSTY
jgi:hypothetical protein